MTTFYVEYEVPPTRAINHTYFEASSEADVRSDVAANHPLWRTRKIEKCCGACSCRIDEFRPGCNPVDA